MMTSKSFTASGLRYNLHELKTSILLTQHYFVKYKKIEKLPYMKNCPIGICASKLQRKNAHEIDR